MILQTPRLFIRELLPSDEAAMFAMDSDPEVHRFLGNMPYTDIQQSRENINIIRQQYTDHGIGRWAVELKETGAFIGWTGFKRMVDKVNGHVGHLDFGYRHARRYWGNGYAYEAAKAGLDYGVATLGFTDIYAMTDVHNAGSRYILEKLGFELVEVFAYDAPPSWRAHYGEPTTWYRFG
jgi:ribosomal-protein-alanine N-acetyltransferase